MEDRLSSDEHSPLLRSGNASANETRSTRSSEQPQQQQLRSRSRELHGRRLYVTLLFPYLGSLLAAVDTTLTSTCAGQIASDFSSLALISWLGSAYLIGTAAIQPIGGKLTDRYGRKTGCLLALVFFALGNLACALAQTAALLIIGRIVAGIGAGGIGATCVFITNDSVNLRKRGLWQGVLNILWAAGIGLGAVVGGAINDWVGWRYAFLGLTPLTIIVFLGVTFTLRSASEKESAEEFPPVDFVGIVTLTGSIVTIITSFNLIEGGRDMKIFLILMGISAFLLMAFILNELRFAKDPVLPIRLLPDRSVMGVCLAAFFLMASLHTLLFYVPILIQARGYSTGQVGLQLLGEVVGASTGSLTAGILLNAFGSYALLKPVVYLLYLAAPLLFYLSKLDWAVWTTVLSLIAMGSGTGGVITVLITGLLAVTDQKVQAPVMSLLYAFRQVGASSGLAASGILFRAMLGKQLKDDSSANPVDNIAHMCSQTMQDGAVRPKICVKYGESLHFVFLFALILGALSFVSSLFLRNASLERKTENSAEHRAPNAATSDA